ncbi:MAG: GxxExxY protein [Acidobacteriales bacterium]|nr:GxxExxY protein [Terriglobales bacterium]
MLNGIPLLTGSLQTEETAYGTHPFGNTEVTGWSQSNSRTLVILYSSGRQALRKCVRKLPVPSSVHHKLLVTYLRLSRTRLGLLINFNVPCLREGITRLANRFPED